MVLDIKKKKKLNTTITDEIKIIQITLNILFSVSYIRRWE